MKGQNNQYRIMINHAHKSVKNEVTHSEKSSTQISNEVDKSHPKT